MPLRWMKMMAEINRKTLVRHVRRFPGFGILRRSVDRFARRNDGAVAVEFALVAAPFLALVFAIIETAVVFFAGQTLETAVADSARLIMTGQAQTAGFTQQQFKDQVCSRIYGLFNCSSGVAVDVRTYSSFSSINLSKPIDANGNLDTSKFTYSPGGPGDIVVVRLYYQWPVYVSLLGLNLADLSGNKRLIVATAAFRNEPYQ
ncbi:MAG TPA: TadE/TadG family type IV pilus assembly protein [Pseudorhodoplanes sp.]|nr:TadE/TadG family type IV pilus assembly protein [Pseudorhodoplanes sp.]